MIRRNTGLALVSALGAASSLAVASDVYVLSSGNAPLDALVKSRLEEMGHTVVIGPQFTGFDGSQSLAPYDAVYFQANANYAAGDMPAAGQTALKNWVNAGGGLVASEWVAYITASGMLQTLKEAFAVTPNLTYREDLTATYTRVTANPVMDRGLSTPFVLSLTNYDGTEGRLVPKAGATTFYSTAPFPQGAASGVVGGAYGAGRVLHISTTCGTAQLNDPEGQSLLSNAVAWAGRERTVLVLSSSVAALDTQVRTVLQARGFEVTIGPEFTSFNATTDLKPYRAVYLQANANWPDPDMPAAGQTALKNWVESGGGLITCEWVGYLSTPGGGKYFQTLAPLLPMTPTDLYRTTTTTTYTLQTADPILQANLPNVFAMNLTSYAGTESHLLPRAGATQFYSTSAFPAGPGIGVAGWDYGAGRVLSFSTTCGPAQLSTTLFATLFGNAFNWVIAPPDTCYPDCNASGSLTIADFGCFQSKFAAADPYADCNQSGSLTIADFGCFQSQFAAGCP